MNTKQTQPVTEVENHSRRQFLRQAAAGAVIAAPLTGAVAAVRPAKESPRAMRRRACSPTTHGSRPKAYQHRTAAPGFGRVPFVYTLKEHAMNKPLGLKQAEIAIWA